MSGPSEYRGRLAPSPTGYLHLGHARTFSIAQERAREAAGTLIFRNDDLDQARCRPEFVAAATEDLRWLGFEWTEGPDVGGPFAPYSQSERRKIYERAFEQLRVTGLIYPCKCSRKEIAAALSAPHAGDEEPIYPGLCRPEKPSISEHTRAGINWRFRLTPGERVSFTDGSAGLQSAVSGADFGDVLIWRKDDCPSYQFACVVDDALMQISEVVRGADLIGSTFRQLVLYRAMGWTPPWFFHCPLVVNPRGERLAKRDDALSIRALRDCGRTAEEVRELLRAAPTANGPLV
jgi:glutamyl/glutaminyl-tRNA synthetase